MINFTNGSRGESIEVDLFQGGRIPTPLLIRASLLNGL